MSTNQMEEQVATKSGGAVTFFGVIFSLLFFIGGLAMMGYAFSIDEHQLWLFLGGILATSFGFYISVSLVQRIDGQTSKH